MDLIEFLRARFDEDEAVAQAAGGRRWSWSHGFGEMCNDPTCPYGHLVADSDVPTLLMEVHGFDIHQPWQGAAHIARWDPAHVLAEIEAKRAIVEMAERTYRESDDYPGWEGAVLHLAQPYADHPDFDPTWRVPPTDPARPV